MRHTKLTALSIACIMLTSDCGPAHAKCEGKLGISRLITLPVPMPNRPLSGKDLGLADREVILTFDDGPSDWTTPSVLDELESECVKATFFMLGKNIAQNQNLAKRVLDAGHGIGSHTLSHQRLSAEKASDAQREITEGANALRNAMPASFHSKLFRFPYLSQDLTLLKITRTAGLIAINVDISGDDYTGNACAVSVAKIMSQLERAGRGIILMHDVMGNTPCETKMLLASLKLRNFRIVHLHH